MKHFPVKWDGKLFTFGFGHFESVHELSEHFASRPVIGGDSGMWVEVWVWHGEVWEWHVEV